MTRNSTLLTIFAASILLLINTPTSIALRDAIRGKKCAQNQVVNKLTVFEDGAIEAECGSLPCGATGICSEDLSSCKTATDVFSGMRWARNGQSLLLRCCSLQAGNKAYVGTDLVTLGSYYSGGVVPEKDMMGNSGVEYDFVANARTEQGGVRVWVYRIVCSPTSANDQQQQQIQQHQTRRQHQPVAHQRMEDQMSNDEQPTSEVQDAQIESQQNQEAVSHESATNQQDGEEHSISNPLQYRPRRNHRQQGPDSPVNRVI